MPTQKPKKRGGARPGAGRKKDPNAAVSLTTFVSKEVRAVLVAIATTQNRSVSAVAADVLQQALKPQLDALFHSHHANAAAE